MEALSFKEKLLLLRKEKGISQKKLADLLDIAVQNLSRYENGEYLPKPSILVKLSEIFNVSIDYLLLENHSNSEIIDFKDPEFVKLMKIADKLSDTEKGRLKNLMKSYLTDNKV